MFPSHFSVTDFGVFAVVLVFGLIVIVICCGSKNSSKSLFSRFTGFDSFYGDASTIRAGS